jgi:ribose transport system substrate-binding protein
MRRVRSVMFAVLIFVVAACGAGEDEAPTEPAADDTPEEADDEDLLIGLANFRLDSVYFINMEEAMADEAEQLGLEYISTDAGQDAAKLASDVEDMIAQGVDGVVLQASPLQTVPAVTEALEAAGIPLVLVNRRLPDDTYASWIGADNTDMGRNAGEFIAERMGGEGKLVILRGGPEDNPVGIARTEGVRSMVDDSDIEVVVAPGFGEWTEDGGFGLMSDMLVAHDDIAAVFCENDGMCLGALRAIEDAGRADEVFIVGVDAVPEALDAIRADGPFVGSALNDADSIGRQGVRHLLEILRGEEVERDLELPGPLIHGDNIDEFFD